MEIDASVLVATDNPKDADRVRETVAKQVAEFHVSTRSGDVVADFESCLPDVLILAFDTVEKAEHYYLVLSRGSTKVLSHQFRSILLCNSPEVEKAYNLCANSIFDEYVPFWPSNQDPYRLAMAVHQAARVTGARSNERPQLREFAYHSKRVAEVESAIQQLFAEGEQHSEDAEKSVEQVRREMEVEINQLVDKLADFDLPEVTERIDVQEIQMNIGKFKHGVDKGLETVAAAVDPFKQWTKRAPEAIEPQMESVRALKSMADRVMPVVLVVDDDEFQHKVVRQIFPESTLELVFARSGAEALSILRAESADVVLLDVDMPGVDGIETLRHIRTVDRLKDTPVVMITGHRGKDIVMECIDAGASGYVVKPFDKADLRGKVHAILDVDHCQTSTRT